MEKTTLDPVRGTVRIPLIYQAPSAPKGIVQILHGMCEHKERYIPLMEYLAENGYAAVCHDHLGHGEAVAAAEDLGYVGKDGWNDWVENSRCVTQWARDRWPGVPLTLFGHSMGSMVARSYTKRYDALIDRLIVCGCPSDNPAKGAGILMSRMFGRIRGSHFRPQLMQNMSFGNYNKPFASEGWPAAWVCSDPEVLKAYHADPLCQFIFTADGFENLLLLMKDCYSAEGWAMKKPGLPVHFISGAEDPCRVSDDALGKAVDLMKQVGYETVTLKLYPGMRHEIHNETGRKAVWEDILGYIGN